MKKQSYGTMRHGLQRIATITAILCLALFCLAGCESDHGQWDLKTIDETTDQVKLSKFAVKSKWDYVRSAAVRKLTNQALLSKIAAEDPSRKVRRKAKDRIAEIRSAEKEKIIGIRRAAVEKLTDQTTLLKIAVEDEAGDIRHAAYRKLNDAAMADLAATATNPEIRLYAALFLKIQHALHAIPKEHQLRLGQRVFGCFNILAYPFIVAELGDIEAIQIQWKLKSKEYEKRLLHYSGENPAFGRSTGEFFIVQGESIKISIKTNKMEQAVFFDWFTHFPSKADLKTRWIDPEIKETDFFQNVCGFLSVTSLLQIALEAKDSDIRLVAVNELTDQAVLAKAALEDTDHRIRCVAVEKLNDQAILAKIALEEVDASVCRAAVEKLSDQAVLAEIALKEDNDPIRRAAVKKLADQAMLAKIAMGGDSTVDPTDRKVAVEKLTNQAVLSNIAAQDENVLVRAAANKRLLEVREDKPKEQPQKEKAQIK